MNAVIAPNTSEDRKAATEASFAIRSQWYGRAAMDIPQDVAATGAPEDLDVCVHAAEPASLEVVSFVPEDVAEETFEDSDMSVSAAAASTLDMCQQPSRGRVAVVVPHGVHVDEEHVEVARMSQLFAAVTSLELSKQPSNGRVAVVMPQGIPEDTLEDSDSSVHAAAETSIEMCHQPSHGRKAVVIPQGMDAEAYERSKSKDSDGSVSATADTFEMCHQPSQGRMAVIIPQGVELDAFEEFDDAITSPRESCSIDAAEIIDYWQEQTPVRSLRVAHYYSNTSCEAESDDDGGVPKRRLHAAIHHNTRQSLLSLNSETLSPCETRKREGGPPSYRDCLRSYASAAKGRCEPGSAISDLPMLLPPILCDSDSASPGSARHSHTSVLASCRTSAVEDPASRRESSQSQRSCASLMSASPRSPKRRCSAMAAIKEQLFPTGVRQNAAPHLLKLRIFLRRIAGSCLVAWVRHFDRDNDQRIKQGEFMYVLQKLKFQGDAKDTFAEIDVDKSGEISFNEIEPKEATLWQTFRLWCVATFSGVDDIMLRLGGKKALHENQLEQPEFCEGIVDLGWKGGSQEVLFNALALSGDHTKVKGEDLTWFCIELHRFKIKETAKKQTLERANQRGAILLRGVSKQAILAKFKDFLRQTYGGYFRAWRASFGGRGTYFLRQKQFFKACAEQGFTKDVRILWKAFGKSESAYCHLRVDEFDLPTASILARFQSFLCERYSSVMRAFARLSKQGAKKISQHCIAQLVSQDEGLCDHAQLIFCELRQAKAKKLTRQDFVFLEHWNPIGYLCHEPSIEAAEKMKACLLKKCKNYLKAWRQVLDPDSSNYCTWDEFEDCCRSIGFDGDIGGAWLALDTDLSGSISLEEVDPISHSILVDFKRWADSEFGSVKSTFHVFDHDRQGTLSLKEWCRGCRIYGYEGCPRLLFYALDVDGNSELSIFETGFLDGWPMDIDHEALKEELSNGDMALVASKSHSLQGVIDDIGTKSQAESGSQQPEKLLPVSVLRELERAAIHALEVLGPPKQRPNRRKSMKVEPGHPAQPSIQRASGLREVAESFDEEDEAGGNQRGMAPRISNTIAQSLGLAFHHAVDRVS